MIKITQKGDFKRTHKFLNSISKNHIEHTLRKYGEMGVQALVEKTPVTTGKTAGSWAYEIERGDGSYSIIWTNSNVNNGVNIAVILQYGHGTGTGGYVKGIDYINPALKPVFEELADKVWKEVTDS